MGRKIMSEDLENLLRNIFGFLILVTGVIASLWLLWWLSFKGDIIDIIHKAKMSLPGWTWVLLKFGLSGAFGVIVIFITIVLAMMVLGGGRRN
jgi:hypothetical protein